MSAFSDIQNRINKRAAELVLPRFLELMAQRHANSGFREGCECTYCRAKRAATSEIGHLGRSILTRPRIENDPHYEKLDPWDKKSYERQIIRDSLREKHRGILKGLFHE